MSGWLKLMDNAEKEMMRLITKCSIYEDALMAIKYGNPNPKALAEVALEEAEKEQAK